MRKPWITDQTHKHIIDKHKAEENGPSELLTQLIKDVRKSKRKDWKAWVKQSVVDDLDVRDKGLGIKILRKKHAPNLYERADVDGRTVNLTEKATASADYLAIKQWGIPAEPLPTSGDANGYYTAKRSTRPNNYKLGEFTLSELKIIIKKMKRNKASGPDDMPMEYFKWLDDPSLEYVLHILNGWWNQQHFIINKLKADTASIYKKRNPKLRENYRPISLLRSIYKIYASLLQTRPANAIGDDLQKTVRIQEEQKHLDPSSLCSQTAGQGGVNEILDFHHLPGLGKSF